MNDNANGSIESQCNKIFWTAIKIIFFILVQLKWSKQIIITSVLDCIDDMIAWMSKLNKIIKDKNKELQYKRIKVIK